MEFNAGEQRPETDGNLDELIETLASIRSAMVEAEMQGTARYPNVHPRYRESARNLLHYLTLRRVDLRSVQQHLSSLGLSSLGRSEASILASIETLLDTIHKLAGREASQPIQKSTYISAQDGSKALARHTEDLLGPAPPDRNVRIMVTMPSEAARDYAVVHTLLEAGMNCMRINCAHDNAAAWERMIQHLRRAEQSLDRKCRVLMDLAGPKLRTGPIESTPGVIKIRPVRDSYGKVLAPARVWLTEEHNPHEPPTYADACVPVSTNSLASLSAGSRIRLRDARGAKRYLDIVDVCHGGVWAQCWRSVYIVQEIALAGVGKFMDKEAKVGELPIREQSLILRQGDTLVLTHATIPGKPAQLDSKGRLLTPARIGCTLPSIFADVRPGERIWIDDGKVGGVIRTVDAKSMTIQVTHAKVGGVRVQADKGINLPDSKLKTRSLTRKDISDLEFIARHADIVGFSFVRKRQDVADLERYLGDLRASHIGVVLKIETREAFENLPDLLLESMVSPCDGVMIARGDLAVECGFERLAEVQEEILWICEAAHIPVIWATQVLETLAKKGIPSRSEITDAALGQRAECVMLNKGPHIVTAVRVLDDIL
ncbi:MAG: pyruvate kinase, partial [Pirellulales bacterium]